MKPLSKTPYEIRLELLQLAQSILNAKHAATAAEEAQHKNGGVTYLKTSPTTEEIIAEADKLNGFVSKASLTHPNH
jgi:hypothetical protein